MKGAPSDQIQLRLLLQYSAFLLSVPFDDAQLFPSVSISESLVGISKVPAAGLFQGSVLRLQRVDEKLSCFHRAGGAAGSVSEGAGSLLNSTLPLQAPRNARADKMLRVVTGDWCFPARREPIDPFIWYLWWDQEMGFAQSHPYLGSTSHKVQVSFPEIPQSPFQGTRTEEVTFLWVTETFSWPLP